MRQSCVVFHDSSLVPARWGNRALSLWRDPFRVCHRLPRHPDSAVELAGVLGYGSSFCELHGFYVDAVDPTTATLPDRWQHRAIVIQGGNTIAAGSKLRARGFCLDIHDLLVSKYGAARETL